MPDEAHDARPSSCHAAIVTQFLADPTRKPDTSCLTSIPPIPFTTTCYNNVDPGIDRRTQLLFIQGGGEGTHDEWDNKLVDSLSRELGPNFETRYPRMPNEDDPSFAEWKTALEKEFARLDDGAILVGHSIGATILVNALAQAPSKRKFRAIFLIAAPFIGEGGWPSDDMNPPRDLGARLPRGVPVYIYHGLADETAPASHAELYARAIPQAKVHRLPNRDHQLNNDLSEIAATIKSLDKRR